MRKLILVAFCVLMTSNVHAARPTEDDKQFCAVLSQYAWLIANNRFTQGMEKDEQYPALAANNRIHPTMVDPINKVIEIVYRDDFPLMTDAASVASFTNGVYENCLDLRTAD